MRLLDKRATSSQGLVLLLALHMLLFVPLWEADALAVADTDGLEVKAEPGGGIRATAHPIFPAKPEVIQALLADYSHWPDLF